MRGKVILAFSLAVLLLGYFLYLDFKEYYERNVEYSVDEMYVKYSFEEFKRFNFWDLISKEDIDRIRAQDKNRTKLKEVFYNAGIYTWLPYSFHAWDVVEGNISCPRNMTHEEFHALIQNMSPKYGELRNAQKYYLKVFKDLEDEVTEPGA